MKRELKISDRLNAMDIDCYVDAYSKSDFSTVVSDEKSQKLIKKLFEITDCIEPVGSDEKKVFWIMAPRGEIEQYKNEFCDDEPAAEEWFYEDYPDEVEWYKFTSMRYEDIYGIFIDNNYVLSINDVNSKGIPTDTSEFVSWLIQGAENAVNALKNNAYNDYVRENLPNRYKYGRISRKDYWDIYPNLREEYFSGFSEEELEKFKKYASEKDAFSGKETIAPRDFYEACAVGYRAAGYKLRNPIWFTDSDEEHKRYGYPTPKELYYMYADGRDDNLKEVPMDDEEAFLSWMDRKGCYEFNGGHPWEIRSSLSIRFSIHLFIRKNEETGKFEFELSGDAFNTSAETIKMFVAMRDAGIPVSLYEKEFLLGRILEKDSIGVLPQKCSLFGAVYGNPVIGYDVKDFVQLCSGKKIEDKVKWINENEINLK